MQCLPVSCCGLLQAANSMSTGSQKSRKRHRWLWRAGSSQLQRAAEPLPSVSCVVPRASRFPICLHLHPHTARALGPTGGRDYGIISPRFGQSETHRRHRFQGKAFYLNRSHIKYGVFSHVNAAQNMEQGREAVSGKSWLVPFTPVA